MLGILTREKSKRLYPPQFWVLFWGVFINRVSFSMLWPFLTIFMVNKLGVPLTTVTLLISLRSLSSLLGTGVVAPMMDRVGRKQGMVFGLLGSSIIFGVMAFASGLPIWAVLMFAHGIVMPMFNIGVYSMVADMVGEDTRPKAYALIRVVANAGIAVGPVIGGALAVISFEIIFVITGMVFALLALLVYLFVPETRTGNIKTKNDNEARGGYGVMLRDRVFLGFIGAYLLTEMAATHMFTLLPVYVSGQFGLVESQYSLLVTINAVMVVLFQYSVTRYTSRFKPFAVIALGSFFYAVGTLSVAFGSTFGHFAISMVIATIGELIASPTALTLVANLAPTHMRARYMGVMEMMYPIGSGVGPVIGGLLNDNVAPVAMWYSAGIMAFAGTLAFVLLANHYNRQSSPHVET
jgi:MFS family permease